MATKKKSSISAEVSAAVVVSGGVGGSRPPASSLVVSGAQVVTPAITQPAAQPSELAVQGLFPTPIAMAQLNRNITKAEMDYIFALEMSKNMGNLVSKHRTVLNDPAMADIRKFIEFYVEEYLRKVMSGSSEVRLAITQSWVNVTQSGQFHHVHKHPNSVVSGVFYPQATSERDRIYFMRDGMTETIRIDPQEYSVWNSSTWWIPVRTGMLVLFPSGLTHKVADLEEGDDRISLSFNTFVVGNVGSPNDLTALHVDSVLHWRE